MRSNLSSLFLAPILLMSPGLMAQYSLESLRELRWENRIILIRSETDNRQWINTFETEKKEIIDRDIVWFDIQDRPVKTNFDGKIADSFWEDISNRYFQDERTRVVLIGKDGGVKAVSDKLNLAELFALIDGMPMRRAEMREKAN